jgi:rsbT co-antagonist protein RsbR
MDSSKKQIVVDEARVERVIESIAFASTGAFQEAIDHLNATEQDSFGVIEESLRILLMELASATQKSAEALDMLGASKRELEDKLATIERQRMAIRELSVPIIDVWDDILTLPLVGVFDTSRAVDITEKLLQRVSERRTRWVIVDLTGVAVVDTMTAQHLIQLARAVQLLGARCILTGLGPDVARTLATIGVSFDELNPMRSLREALEYCISRRL